MKRSSNIMNILSFDIEEWFHILDNPSTKTEKQWVTYEVRIHKNMDTIFSILEKYNMKGTFFVVGWIAEKYPEVVRRIAEAGHQIGSHTHMHQLAYEQDRVTFQNDVDRSIKTLEDCIGEKIELFRAPGFSIKEENKWAFEVLYELGITTDSSIFPADHAHGGLKNYPVAKPSIIQYNGASLKEFPINSHSFLGKPFIFSGGGYFRLFPYHFIKRATRQTDYVMSYFHPRDFDVSQPMINDLSWGRKFKSYVGLKKSKQKLEYWLNDFDFIDIKEADKLINWQDAKIIRLDEN